MGIRPAHYERPGGLLERKERRTPRLLRGKPFRRIQRELYQRLYRYPHRNLLVIAQPKSGSTWLWRMLLETPGVFRWFPESMKGQTLRMEDFHDLDYDEMASPPPGYTVTATHTEPKPANIDALARLARPYVILVRDPRDMAVSWAYFVANRPENAYHEATAGMSVGERIEFYFETHGARFADWATGWSAAMDPRRGMLVRYEDMLDDTAAVLRRVLVHFGIEPTDRLVRTAVERHTFERTTNRPRGTADATQFFRKGVAGDWREHFTPGHVDLCKAVAGRAIVELGYEPGPDWSV